MNRIIITALALIFCLQITAASKTPELTAKGLKGLAVIAKLGLGSKGSLSAGSSPASITLAKGINPDPSATFMAIKARVEGDRVKTLEKEIREKTSLLTTLKENFKKALRPATCDNPLPCAASSASSSSTNQPIVSLYNQALEINRVQADLTKTQNTLNRTQEEVERAKKTGADIIKQRNAAKSSAPAAQDTVFAKAGMRLAVNDIRKETERNSLKREIDAKNKELEKTKAQIEKLTQDGQESSYKMLLEKHESLSHELNNLYEQQRSLELEHAKNVLFNDLFTPGVRNTTFEPVVPQSPRQEAIPSAASSKKSSSSSLYSFDEKNSGDLTIAMARANKEHKASVDTSRLQNQLNGLRSRFNEEIRSSVICDDERLNILLLLAQQINELEINLKQMSTTPQGTSQKSLDEATIDIVAREIRRDSFDLNEETNNHIDFFQKGRRHEQECRRLNHQRNSTQQELKDLETKKSDLASLLSELVNTGALSKNLETRIASTTNKWFKNTKDAKEYLEARIKLLTTEMDNCRNSINHTDFLIAKETEKARFYARMAVQTEQEQLLHLLKSLCEYGTLAEDQKNEIIAKLKTNARFASAFEEDNLKPVLAIAIIEKRIDELSAMLQQPTV